MKQNGMKFNKETKEEVRAELDKMLSRVRFNPKNRISNISKADLEMILFDQDPKTGLKVIGWHSKNLKKLDLSKVSFAGVFLGDEQEKDLSDTNIKIDLSKCAWREYGCVDGSTDYDLFFNNVKFDNVDLSKTTFRNVGKPDDHYFTFNNCSLADTGLRVFDFTDTTDSLIKFEDCNLKGINLEGIQLRNIFGYSTIAWANLRFNGINSYENTGIAVKVNGNPSKEDLKNLLAKDRLAGCHILINDKIYYLKTVKEKKAEARKVRKSYNEFINERTAYIIAAVEDAIKHRYNRKYKPIGYDFSGDEYTISKPSLDKIRDEVAAVLKNQHYDADHRIKLDNSLLDLLLFDYCADTDNDWIYKKLGYRDHTIDVLDLKGADFSNIVLIYPVTAPAFLSGTNARIWFTSSYEYKKYGEVIVKNIDLAGVDLSNNDLSRGESEFYNCDLRETGIDIRDVGGLPYHFYKFEECRLDGLDLSEVSMEVNGKGAALEIKNCDLSDTGLKIYTSYNSTEEEIKRIYSDRRYVGCFLNGKPIIGTYERDRNKVAKLDEYNKFAARKKKMILTNVQKAISKED